MPRFNKRGSFGEETTATPVMSLPTGFTGSRGSDEDNHVTQNMNKSGDGTDKTPVEEYQHDTISVEGFPPLGPGSGQSSTAQVSSGPFHPGTILPRHKPSLRRLEDLAGLSVVTWEEFLELPSRLGGLFQGDREEFIHYNPQQVNVFFHDSRMEQPTLGARQGTDSRDSYNHLRSVRSWLTERVSVILLHMLTPKTQAAAACLLAINPTRKAVGARLHDAFSSAVDAFLQHRNFCIEIDLNACVQSWCRTALKVPCQVTGGRIVITNAEERVPCSRVDSVPFCVACFPLWGIRKLSYKYKRQAEYEDIFVAFTAEDLQADNTSPPLPQSTENGSKNAKSKPASTKAPAKDKGRVWTKSNKHSAGSPATTLGSKDSLDVRASLEVEEVDSSGDSRPERRRPKRFHSKRDKERGQVDSGFSSSDNASTAERSEPQLSKGIPDYRRHNPVPPRPSDKAKRTSRNQRNLDDASSTSASTSYASSVLSPAPKDGGPRKPAASISWQVVQDVEEEIRDSDFMNLPSNASSQDSRAEFARTFSVVEPEDEEGDYTLLEESPRPDTPYLKPLAAQSLKGKRPTMMSQGAAITEERQEQGGKLYSRNTAGNFPQQQQQRSSSRSHLTSPAQQEQSLYAMDNDAFEYDDAYYPASKARQGSDRRVKEEEKSRGSKAFPYTSEYLDALGRMPRQSPSYGLVDQDITRGDELRRKKQPSPGKEPADTLFAARDASHYPQFTNGEDTISGYSDEDDVTASKLKNTGVTWESDYYYDQDEDGEDNELPRILPGAKGAQQLRSSREFPAQGGGGEVWKRGGQQYDSRRRYIALNSLRRKSNQQALQAELRKQRQSEDPQPSSSPCELIEF